MFGTVLVGVDGRDGGRDAIALAQELAAPDAVITLAHVSVRTWRSAAPARWRSPLGRRTPRRCSNASVTGRRSTRNWSWPPVIAPAAPSTFWPSGSAAI
jgi:hypothetical protein